MGILGLKATFPDVYYPPEKYPSQVSNGYITLPNGILPKVFKNSFVPQLTTFGFFPKISLNNFTLEYRFKYLEKIFKNQREFNGALFCHDYMVAELPSADSGWGSENSFYFETEWPIDKPFKGQFETKINTEWNTIKVVVNQGRLRYYINNDVHFETGLNHLTDSLLWGISFKSNCKVGIDNVRFTDGQGKLLYANEFNDLKTLNTIDPKTNRYQKICGAGPAIKPQ